MTAVPTRIRYGSEIAAFLRYGNGDLQKVSVGDFQTAISEAGNPGNRRAITRTLLEIPAQRLSRGVVLVDTPGLGSLALRGASETLAYLPSCDLALLLIDAGGTLTMEDIGTLRLILEAEIPALVLLSKSDLLSHEEAQSTVAYIEGQIDRELHQSVAVHPISSTKDYRPLLEAFYAEELQPRLEHAQELKIDSVASKLSHLRHDVITSLEAKESRAERAGTQNSVDSERIEHRLREISGSLGELGPWLDRHIEALRNSSGQLLATVAEALSSELKHAPRAVVSSQEITQELQHAVTRQLEPLIAEVNKVLSRAIDETTQIGNELGRTDLPDRKELEPLVRNFPQFPTVIVPTDIAVGIWKYFGKQAANSHMQKQVQKQLGMNLQEELRTYATGLFQWARQLTHLLDFSINSYVETYRVSIQESMSNTATQSNLEGIADDIQALRTAGAAAVGGANEISRGA